MKTIFVDLPNGYKIKLLENTKGILKEVWDDKFYEQDFDIAENMNILDIGANQGFFSLYAAAKGANVYAVEPEDRNYEILNENIIDNELGDKIKSYKYAVSDKNDYIDLFIPDFNLTDASALVSTSKSFLKTKKLDQSINIKKVPCITLSNLLKKIGMKNIDLLKMDCEGAEIDILKNMPKKLFRNIHYIVMESHSNYSDKDIVYIVKKLGFNIVNFKKSNDLTHTGYLFAENEKMAGMTVWDYPVAILENLPFYKEDEQIILDASKSFSSAGKNNKLVYSWIIDSINLSFFSKSTLKTSVSQNGLHCVELRITDKNGMTDYIKKYIWILEKTYFEKYKESVMQIEHSSEKVFTFNELQLQNFYAETPNDWVSVNIGFSFEYEEEKRFTAVFQFNGQKYDLSQKNNVFEFMQIPSNFIIYFSIHVRDREKIKMKWWFNEEKPLSQLSSRLYEDHPEYTLFKQGKEEEYEIISERYFVISHEELPTTWSPEFIEIKIVNSVEGYFECKGKKVLFNDSYKLIRLDFRKIDLCEDIVFRIVNQSKDKIFKLEWWFNDGSLKHSNPECIFDILGT